MFHIALNSRPVLSVVSCFLLCAASSTALAGISPEPTGTRSASELGVSDWVDKAKKGIKKGSDKAKEGLEKGKKEAEKGREKGKREAEKGKAEGRKGARKVKDATR